jgi:hypothetical protein
VVAQLAHELTIDPLRMKQWRFFVVPRLDHRTRGQHPFRLRSLKT